MEIYLAYTVKSTDEVLMALLTQFEFESFEEHEDHFIGYIKKDDLTAADQDEIISIITRFTDDYKIDDIEPQNWNAIWEASFQPVEVGDFCQIRADFHPKSADVRYDLVINPKMAFGTGHHATTALILEWMTGETFNGLSVLDFGCGTGILGIYAKKKGCRNLVMVDIELQAVENAFEHCELNHVHADAILEGSAEVIPAQLFDIIFANITRNVLEELLPKLRSHCAENGKLIISGFLKQDELFMISCLEKNQFRVKSTFQKEDWIAILADVV